MENKYLLQIKNLILNTLKDEKVKVFIFGSRVRGDNCTASDVDIGYIPKDNFDERKITFLKDRFEDSTIPYKVEVINFNSVSEDFRNEALKDIEIWKD